jgi:hypothetical protein
MIYLISSLFYILSFSILADEHISLLLLNSELKKNYAFTERSLNQSDLKIESSSGNIYFDPNGITVNVLSPFEENYRVEGDFLEIHDVFLDQKQTIDIREANIFFLDLLINGIDKNSSDYKVNQTHNSVIEIIPSDGSASIKFFFIDKSLNLIRYKDSIGVEHGIELSPI